MKYLSHFRTNKIRRSWAAHGHGHEDFNWRRGESDESFAYSAPGDSFPFQPTLMNSRLGYAFPRLPYCVNNLPLFPDITEQKMPILETGKSPLWTVGIQFNFISIDRSRWDLLDFFWHHRDPVDRSVANARERNFGSVHANPICAWTLHCIILHSKEEEKSVSRAIERSTTLSILLKSKWVVSS